MEHLIKPLQNRLAIIDKERGTRQERQEREAIAQAAASDEPPVAALVEAALGTRALLKKLGSIEERLERMGSHAEAQGSPTGVAAIAGQQIRGLEFGAKLGGHPNFLPPRTIAQSGEAAQFAVNIIFNDTGKVESITTTSRTVEGSADWINGEVASSESSSADLEADEGPTEE
jgi:hypothetical protein